MKNENILRQLLINNHLNLNELDQAEKLLKSLTSDVKRRISIQDPKRIQKVEFHGKEYNDKENANSYFSSRIYVDRYDGTTDIYTVSFTYGYENQYVHNSFKKLIDLNVIKLDKYEIPQYYFSSMDIEFISIIDLGCSEKEVLEWSEL
jgi:hypothetical protein